MNTCSRLFEAGSPVLSDPALLGRVLGGAAEILNTVHPGLATTDGPRILISSPYARRGELWRLYRPAGDPATCPAGSTA